MSESASPGKPHPPAGRGRRRGRRGGRGRSRPAPEKAATVTEATPATEAGPLVERVAALAAPRTDESSPPASAITQAIHEVMNIVESLKRVVEQMEEVLELVELAERQKLADEQEIESLRRALRQLQRPRGQHPSREEVQTS